MGNDFIIYNPKILVEKYKKNKLIKKEFDLLGDYLFCFHKKQRLPKLSIKEIRNYRRAWNSKEKSKWLQWWSDLNQLTRRDWIHIKSEIFGFLLFCCAPLGIYASTLSLWELWGGFSYLTLHKREKI